MIHENVMLQLHGKTHTRVSFFKQPTRFLHFCTFFVKKMKVLHKETTANHENMTVFYNTKAACTLMKKTLPAVSESTRFSAILRGIRKAKARADEGSDRCCCCCCCCWFIVGEFFVFCSFVCRLFLSFFLSFLVFVSFFLGFSLFLCLLVGC